MRKPGVNATAAIESFVEAWVARNMRLVPGGNPVAVVDGLAASLTGDARAEGISGGDLYRAVGDIDDFLSLRYQRMCQRDPLQQR
jgi:hypothetical protein